MSKLNLETPTWHYVAMTPQQKRRFKLNLTRLRRKWDADMDNFDAKGRIWDVKRLIRVDTHFGQSLQGQADFAPEHFFFSPPPTSALALLKATTSALHTLRLNLHEEDQRLQEHCHMRSRLKCSSAPSFHKRPI